MAKVDNVPFHPLLTNTESMQHFGVIFTLASIVRPTLNTPRRNNSPLPVLSMGGDQRTTQGLVLNIGNPRRAACPQGIYTPWGYVSFFTAEQLALLELQTVNTISAGIAEHQLVARRLDPRGTPQLLIIRSFGSQHLPQPRLLPPGTNQRYREANDDWARLSFKYNH